MIRTAMARYVRRFSRIGHSLGPSEERGFELWAGFEIEQLDGDPADYCLLDASSMSAEDLARLDVVTFRQVTEEELRSWKKS